MAEVRLQKFLAECGVGSRRKMEQFITEGRVRINGRVVTELGSKVDPENDKVEVNRKPVHAAPKGIILLNKPRGVVSTLHDPEGRRTVADYLTKHHKSYFPVGRLDWDSTGLMVLTNDGELAERLMHPRFGFERVYHARLEGSLPQESLAKLHKGVKLSDGMVRATGTILRQDENSTWVEVRIQEGRNRVVRRVFEKLGHPVMKLKRTVYGPFKLGKLQVGQLRVLALKEYLKARRTVLNPSSEPDRSEEVPARGDDRAVENRSVENRAVGNRRGGKARPDTRQRGERPTREGGRASFKKRERGQSAEKSRARPRRRRD